MWDDEPEPEQRRSGKWLIRADAAAPVWATIKQRTLDGRLTHLAKAALPRANTTGVICVYTLDYQDLEELAWVLELLRPLAQEEWLNYKTDADTVRGVYGRGAAIYTSPPGRTDFYTQRDGLGWLPLEGQPRRWASTRPAAPPALGEAGGWQIVRWHDRKRHVTSDGITTICGALIPQHATATKHTLDWHKYTNCYNCAYRMWPEHGPAGYIRPTNGQDFPPRRECPHHQGRQISADGCVICTPSAARNWPCPNGCTDPRDHDPGLSYPRCTVFPPRRPAGPDGRCAERCESTDAALHRANPQFSLDLADSALMYCYHCGQPLDLWSE